MRRASHLPCVLAANRPSLGFRQIGENVFDSPADTASVRKRDRVHVLVFRCGVIGRPFRSDCEPAHRYRARLDHALARPLVGFRAETARGVGNEIDFVAVAYGGNRGVWFRPGMARSSSAATKSFI